MTFITTNNITSINAELSNYCNAACPMCARYYIDGKLVKDKVNNTHTTLKFIKEKIGIEIIKKLKYFTSCGNFGDGAMNPECLQIYQWIKEINPDVKLSLHSNGGARNEEFWKGMANIGVSVVFAIDGLEDTNHIYRRNVKWQKLMQNIKAFLEAGGKASWEMLIFKHNEHQVDLCKSLAEQMGFVKFHVKQSARWADFDSEGQWRDLDSISTEDYVIEKSTKMMSSETAQRGNNQKIKMSKNEINEKRIRCYACRPKEDFHEIYIAVNGDVSPCCWLGDLKMHESKNIINDYSSVNLNHTSLENILKGDYFQKLDRGIRGEKDSYRLHTCYYVCGIKDR